MLDLEFLATSTANIKALKKFFFFFFFDKNRNICSGGSQLKIEKLSDWIVIERQNDHIIFITKWQDFSSNSQVVQRVVSRLNDADLLLPLVNDKIYCHVNFLITCMYQYGPEPAPTSRCFKKKRWETCCFFFFFFFFCCFSKRLDMYEDLCVMAASAPDTEISFSAWKPARAYSLTDTRRENPTWKSLLPLSKFK